MFSSTLLCFCLLKFAQIISANKSPYWGVEDTSRYYDQQQPRKAIVTLGRYSESDGDRDMLTGSASSAVEWDKQQKSVGTKWTVGQHYGGHNSRDDPGGRQLGRPVLSALSSDKNFRPPAISAANSPRALPPFDTSLPRFASAPPPGSAASIHRFVLPPGVIDQLRNGISMKSWRENPPRPIGEAPNPNNDGKNMAIVGGKWSTTVEEMDGEAKKERKTLILTNDRIAAPPSMAAVRTPSSAETEKAAIAPSPSPSSTDQLGAFRHEDIRPAAGGERVGPQAKFAGQTNEYKEDWGKELTGSRQRSRAGEYFGANRFNGGEGPASRMVGSGINPPPDGTHIKVGGKEQNVGAAVPAQSGLVRGKLSPYTNAPEEITESRFRNIDEHFNAKNNGNRGRGPNRYVKMDLLNE